MWLAWQGREPSIPSAGVTGLLCCAQLLYGTWDPNLGPHACVVGTFPSLPSAAPQECVDWIDDTPQNLRWEAVV